MFKFFRHMLVLAKPMIVAKMVPNARAMTTLTKEQRLELRGSGFVLLREPPLANWVAFAKERIRQEITQGLCDMGTPILQEPPFFSSLRGSRRCQKWEKSSPKEYEIACPRHLF